MLDHELLVEPAAGAAAEDFGQQVERLGLAGLCRVVGRNHPSRRKARHADARDRSASPCAWCSAPARPGGCAAAGPGRARPCHRSFRPAPHRRPARRRRPPPARRCWAHNICRRRRPHRCGSASPSPASSRSPECGRAGSARAWRRPPRRAPPRGLLSMRERRSSRMTSRSVLMTSSVRMRLRMRSASKLHHRLRAPSGATVWWIGGVVIGGEGVVGAADSAIWRGRTRRRHGSSCP